MQAETWQARNEAAAKVFGLYITGQLSPDALNQCLPDKNERDDFANSVPTVFYDESLKILESKAARTPNLTRLMRQVRRKLSKTNILGFQVLHFRTTDYQTISTTAAYDRSSHFIFMEIDQIPPNEWLINLVHELAHYIDQRMPQAISIYSNQKTATAFAARAKEISDPALLTREEKIEFDRWLMAALDRGFLGEYRAWVVTLAIYQEGVGAGLWQPIDDLESWLKMRGPGESLAKIVMRRLDPTFLDPDPNDSTSGIFRLALVQNELKSLRAEIRHNLQSLYNLADFVVHE